MAVVEQDHVMALSWVWVTLLMLISGITKTETQCSLQMTERMRLTNNTDGQAVNWNYKW